MEKNTVKKWLIWVLVVSVISIIALNTISFISEGKLQYGVSATIAGSSVLLLVAIFTKASSNNTQGIKNNFESINEGILDIKNGVLNVKDDVVNIKSDLIEMKEDIVEIKDDNVKMKKELKDVVFKVTNKELEDAQQFESLTRGFIELEKEIFKNKNNENI